MQHIFVSTDARCRASWREAFPALVTSTFEAVPRDPALIWVLQPSGQSSTNLVRQLARKLVGRSLVLLADEPAEDEALAALSAGAAGYCNGHAAPEVLRQVAMVVENGGIWVGQGLLQRLLSATTRLLPPSEDVSPVWQKNLTQREREAASLLARGASNKEIARQLDITERTVKAHVSALLEKLGARDRLQLSLIINGLEPPR